MNLDYKFIRRSKEDEEVPTIQDRFVEMYYEQDNELDFDSRYYLTCTVFTEAYNLQPPYKNASSFKVVLSNRIRYKRRK